MAGLKKAGSASNTEAEMVFQAANNKVSEAELRMQELKLIYATINVRSTQVEELEKAMIFL